MRFRRAVARALWWVMNPLARRLAGIVPWWVVLETTGRKSGRPRQVPLARGPIDGNVTWLLAVHGPHAGFAHNLDASRDVRLKLHRRWYTGTAAVTALDPAIVRRFNLYARMGPVAFGIDPALVRVDLSETP